VKLCSWKLFNETKFVADNFALVDELLVIDKHISKCMRPKLSGELQATNLSEFVPPSLVIAFQNHGTVNALVTSNQATQMVSITKCNNLNHKNNSAPAPELEINRITEHVMCLIQTFSMTDHPKSTKL